MRWVQAPNPNAKLFFFKGVKIFWRIPNTTTPNLLMDQIYIQKITTGIWGRWGTSVISVDRSAHIVFVWSQYDGGNLC